MVAWRAGTATQYPHHRLQTTHKWIDIILLSYHPRPQHLIHAMCDHLPSCRCTFNHDGIIQYTVWHHHRPLLLPRYLICTPSSIHWRLSLCQHQQFFNVQETRIAPTVDTTNHYQNSFLLKSPPRKSRHRVTSWWITCTTFKKGHEY